MDPEFAEFIWKQKREREAERDLFGDEDDEENEKDWKVEGRSPEGYTPLLAAIHTMDEHIQSLARVTIQLHSKSKPPDVVRNTRPVTALELLEMNHEREEMQELSRAFGFGKKR